MNIGDLFFSLRANDARLQADVKKAGDKAGTSFGAQMGASIRKSFSGAELGKGIVQGLGIAGALGAANLAATAVSTFTDVVSGSIDAASDLNETLTKSEVIFGDNADEMEAWADSAADSFGQSKRAALDTASGFAGLFNTVGFAADEAADKAKELTELGSDLASFFNTDVQTAIDALRSGLSGESEPLRRFNVFLSETAVNSKLLSMGQQKVNGQWTEGQKALARYNLILEQTGSAQGDFARTQDGLANSQRKLQAQWEDALGRLGNVLLPLVTVAVSELSDGLEGLTGIIDILNGKLPENEEGWHDFLVTINSLNPLTWSFTRTLEELRAKQQAAAEAADITKQKHGALGVTFGRAGDAADDLSEDIKGIGKAADGASVRVRVSASDILAAFQTMRDEIVGKGNEVANALYDPIIKAAELADTQAELQSVRQQLRSKGLTDAEVKELERRRQELGKQLIQQNAELLTYGTEAEQISKIKSFLASSFWAQAYRDATPEQAAALDDWRLTLQDRLDHMEQDADEGGKDAGTAYAAGLASTEPVVRQAGGTAASGATTAWQEYKKAGYTWGYGTGAQYAAGLRASFGLVNDAAYYVGRGVGPLKPSSPPPAVPWIVDAGYELGAMWAGGIASAQGQVAAASRTLAGGLSGLAAPGTRSVAIGGSGISSPEGTGKHIEYHIHAEGQLKVPDPLAAANLLARFQGQGLLPEGPND